jgi:aerobic carbon-monoxide dehydrogenase large subunit
MRRCRRWDPGQHGSSGVIDTPIWTKLPASSGSTEDDIRFEAGRFVVSGTDRSVALLDVAATARDRGAPLDTYHAWTREWMTFPNGTHIVEVEIDPDTGQVTLARYTGVDDYGVLVNPMIAAGQAHGAIAHGAGQALFEHAVYDPGSGQL